MIVDSVNFNEKAVKGMSLEAFLKETMPVFWQERDEKSRRDSLTEVWERINPPRKEEKK